MGMVNPAPRESEEFFAWLFRGPSMPSTIGFLRKLWNDLTVTSLESWFVREIIPFFDSFHETMIQYFIFIISMGIPGS